MIWYVGQISFSQKTSSICIITYALSRSVMALFFNEKLIYLKPILFFFFSFRTHNKQQNTIFHIKMWFKIGSGVQIL